MARVVAQGARNVNHPVESSLRTMRAVKSPVFLQNTYKAVSYTPF
jgi:hypothetical protein